MTATSISTSKRILIIIIAIILISVIIFYPKENIEDKTISENKYSINYSGIILEKEVTVKEKSSEENISINKNANNIVLYTIIPKAYSEKEIEFTSNSETENKGQLLISRTADKTLTLTIKIKNFSDKCSINIVLPSVFVDSLQENEKEQLNNKLLELTETEKNCNEINELEKNLAQDLINSLKESWWKKSSLN